MLVKTSVHTKDLEGTDMIIKKLVLYSFRLRALTHNSERMKLKMKNKGWRKLFYFYFILFWKTVSKFFYFIRKLFYFDISIERKFFYFIRKFFYFMWHPNERKFFYFIRKFFYFDLILILCILVCYHGIKHH